MTFQHALKATLPHTSKDKSVPILNGVQVHPGKVVATDRYTAARSTFQHEGHDFEPFVLSTADAKTLAAIQGTPEVTFNLADFTATFRYPTGLSTTLPVVIGDYPNVERLIDFKEGEELVPVEKIVLGVDKMERFKIASLARGHREKATPMSLEFRRNLLHVRFSDHFEGVVGPLRTSA